MAKKEKLPGKEFIKGVGYVPDWYVPSPSHTLNSFLQQGGFPSGAIIQLQSSNPGSFKSSFALQMMANCIKGNLVWNKEPYPFDVAYINAEGAINNEIGYTKTGDQYLKNTWLENMNVDPNKVYWVEPASGEELWEACHDLIEYNNVKYIVLDSIHSIQPSIVHEANAGDSAVMAHAALHTKEVVKSLKIVRENHAMIVGINHLKVKMTAMGAMGETPGGGKAWEFYSQFIVELGRTNSKAKLAGSDYVPLDVYLRKSKGGKSFIPFTTQAKQSFGIDGDAELLEIALENGVIKRSGSWLKTASGETIGQGMSPDVLTWCLLNKDQILQTLVANDTSN